MPYKNNDYKNVIRSARWQRIRAYHLLRDPLCVRCAKKGKTTVATEVHHVVRCHDDPVMQVNPQNLESICNECHLPVSNDERRGHSYEMDSQGYATDPKHPSNRPRLSLKFGTQRNTGREGKKI